MDATARLIQDVLSLNPKCLEIGPGRLANLQALARQALVENSTPPNHDNPQEKGI